MGGVTAQVRHELRVLLFSPLTYIFQVGFLVALGVCTFLIADFYATDEASIRPMLIFLPWVALIMVPALAMRAWADEHNDGALELTLTCPCACRRWCWQVPGRLSGAIGHPCLHDAPSGDRLLPGRARSRGRGRRPMPGRRCCLVSTTRSPCLPRPWSVSRWARSSSALPCSSSFCSWAGDTFGRFLHGRLPAAGDRHAHRLQPQDLARRRRARALRLRFRRVFRPRHRRGADGDRPGRRRAAPGRTVMGRRGKGLCRGAGDDDRAGGDHSGGLEGAVCRRPHGRGRVYPGRGYPGAARAPAARGRGNPLLERRRGQRSRSHQGARAPRQGTALHPGRQIRRQADGPRRRPRARYRRRVAGHRRRGAAGPDVVGRPVLPWRHLPLWPAGGQYSLFRHPPRQAHRIRHRRRPERSDQDTNTEDRRHEPLAAVDHGPRGPRRVVVHGGVAPRLRHRGDPLFQGCAARRPRPADPHRHHHPSGGRCSMPSTSS